MIPADPPLESRVLAIEPHPRLELGAFRARFPHRLSVTASPPWLVDLLQSEADAPVARTESARQTIRDLLRVGGYKPTGRGKPASEYLVRAAEDHTLTPINPAVDAGNAVSLHSGLPISVVSWDRLQLPLRVAIAGPNDTYPFNTAGQVIQLSGLLCLFDTEGPCANAVKDAQRTKTHDDTVEVLALVWSDHHLAPLTAATVSWFRSLMERLGARIIPLEP